MFNQKGKEYTYIVNTQIDLIIKEELPDMCQVTRRECTIG